VYVSDAFGRLAEEYSPATTWLKDFVPFNGQTVGIENASASPCTTCYLSYDYLGTPRLVTDQNANVMGRHDYLPFGDEIPGGVAGCSSQFGPYVDSVDEKFTGQMRDTETLNDFCNARYYTAPLMRFLSSDPGNAGTDPIDPQTWNGYVYVRGNPLNLA
jgi:RHS repeat-associated protein